MIHEESSNNAAVPNQDTLDESVDSVGDTALVIAARKNMLGVVESLLDRDDLDFSSGNQGDLAMEAATSNGNQDAANRISHAMGLIVIGANQVLNQDLTTRLLPQ